MSRRGVDRLALLAVVLWTSLVSSAACDRLTDTSPAHPPVSEGRAAHAALDHPWDPEVTVGPVLNQHLAGRGYPRIFPDDNWWNRDIRDAPVDPAIRRLHSVHRAHHPHASGLRPAALRHALYRGGR